MSWAEFLLYLLSPEGIGVAAGIAWSLLADYIPQFEALQRKYKRLVFFAVCMAFPLVAAALGILTKSWPADFEATFWPALSAGALAFASGTITHTAKMKVTD